MMQTELLLIRLGSSERMEQVLTEAAAGCTPFAPTHDALERGLAKGRRLLIAAHVDAFGMELAVYEFLRLLREIPNCLEGSIACVFIDGDGELYTKQAAQSLILAANLAGCAFPGKPLLEGTGSLYNQHIMAQRMGLSLSETYRKRAQELVQRLLDFEPPRFQKPRVLVLHASSNRQSNTLWLGSQVCRQLQPYCEIETLSVQNGTIHDCRGCSYKTCLHFAQNDTCFYGGAIADEIFPAIRRCNAMLFLCPNYNDAVSANLMALFNRMTNLLVRQDLYDKYLYGIVISGYSGSDLVAQQLLGALCLNKTVMLPPRFCMLETAHDPNTIQHAPQITRRVAAFAENVRKTLCLET